MDVLLSYPWPGNVRELKNLGGAAGHHLSVAADRAAPFAAGAVSRRVEEPAETV